MPILLLIFLLLASCSNNLFYNESAPRIYIEIFNHSDTILIGDTVLFKASINPSSKDVKSFQWTIDSKTYSSNALEESYSFKESGYYNVKFYTVDFFNDTLNADLYISVSNKPVCDDSLELEYFQGSPIFKWNCYNVDFDDKKDSDDEFTYNFILKDSEKNLLDTTLQKDSLQLGYALPIDYWEVYITATNKYGFTAKLDSVWSSP